MSLHTWRHQGPCKPSSLPPSLSALTGIELPQQKKKKFLSLVFMRAGSLWSRLPLCDPGDCGLLGFSVGEGVLQARILEYSWPILVAIPIRALYFLLP